MKEKSVLFISFVLLLHCLSGSMAQSKLCPATENKKAKKYLDDAQDARGKGKPYSSVKPIFEKSIEEDSTWSESWKIFGDAAYINKDYKTAELAYSRATSICPDIGPTLFYRLGLFQFDKKKYKEAEKSLSTFLDFNKVNESDAKHATELIYRARLMSNPVPFEPKPLAGISTPDPEYLACISPDGEFCYFTRRFEMQMKGSLTPVSVEKFMVSEYKNGSFGKGEIMPVPFNRKSINNEGSPSISIDNRYLYFTSNNDNNFDIKFCEASLSGWKDPEPVFEKKTDNDFWEGQPSISPDGNTLYFTSYRDSVTQTGDIYISKKNNGKWSSPTLLPGPINTPGTEKSPFIHPDNQTLYFSSNGLPGMGGFDIYYSKKDSSGNWSQPVNLGYPINTEADEVGFFASTDGHNGYFASNSISSGGYDIYEFPLYKKAMPARVLFIKGELKNEDGEEPLSADIELKNASTKQSFSVNYDSLTGKYASVVLFDEDYIMTVKKKGYAFSSAYFSKDDSSLIKPVKVDLDLVKNQKGKAYTLHNILFSTNSAEMNRQDKIIVDQFSDYLKLNPGITISINGHTDNQGSPSDNLLLSEKRAKSVYDYLITLGIAKERLSFKGFGETVPLKPNDTAEHKAMNRRTEFVIVSL